MRIIKLLGFYLLFSLPFVVCAEQKNVNSDGVIPEHLKIAVLCKELTDVEDFDECVNDLNLEQLNITELCKELTGVDYFDECMKKYTYDGLIQDKSLLYETCGEFSQAGMFDCLNILARNSQKLLNKFEDKRRYPSQNGREDPEYVSEMGGRWYVAKQAFDLYREAYCKFVLSSGTGIGMRLVYPRCIAVQNHRRAALLNNIALRTKEMIETNITVPSQILINDRDLDKKCSGKGDEYRSEGEYFVCLRNETEESFQALKQAEIEMSRYITKWDEHYHYIVAARGKLALANQLFYLYRDAHCAFEASLTGSAHYSTREKLHSMCIAEMNQSQAEQLSL